MRNPGPADETQIDEPILTLRSFGVSVIVSLEKADRVGANSLLEPGRSLRRSFVKEAARWAKIVSCGRQGLYAYAILDVRARMSDDGVTRGESLNDFNLEGSPVPELY
jgi:hypothetical protein